MTTGRAATTRTSTARSTFAELRLRGVAALAALALSACAATGPGAAPGGFAARAPDPTLPPPAVASMRSQGEVDIPFPEGDWTYLGEAEDESVPNFPQRHAIWASAENGVLDRLVTVWRQTRRAEDWYTPFEHCADPDYPYAQVYRNARNDQACWHIRPVNLGLAGDAPGENHMIDGFAERTGVAAPLTMIGVRYVMTDGLARRSIEYLFNPDLLAPAPGGRLWRPEDWTAAAVAADPRRRALVAALRDWGERWTRVALPRPGV